MKSFLINWKTSATGLATVLGALATIITLLSHNPIDMNSVSTAVLALIGGFGLLFAKDGNVTGGTVGQPSTTSALVAANQAPSPVAPPVVK